MNENDKIAKNLKMSLYLITGTNVIGALLFLVAFSVSKNFWYLLLAVVLFAVGIIYIFINAKLRRKFDQIINNKQ